MFNCGHRISLSKFLEGEPQDETTQGRGVHRYRQWMKHTRTAASGWSVPVVRNRVWGTLQEA